MRKRLACTVGALALAGAGAGHGSTAPVPTSDSWLQAVDAAGLIPPGPGVPVLIVDRGLDLSHPELAGRPDTVALNPQTFGETDEGFHATALASIVGGPGTSGGLLGIYPRARIYSWDASPNGSLESHNVQKGIEVASHYCPGVILLSLGFSGDYFFYARYLLQEGIELAVQRGCLVVAAGGNERYQGSPPFYPADLPHVVAVAATQQSGALAPFSSASAAIDLAAPGVDIPIAVPLSDSPSGYGLGTGTSYSAAIVAGAAAWIWTLRPELQASQITELLRRSARALSAARPNDDTGWGLLDVAAALSTPAPPPDPLEPNDDIWYDLPLGLPNAGAPPLTSPAHPQTTIQASVTPVKDPVDVYRVWAPAGGIVSAKLAPSAGLVLRLWSDRAQNVFEQGADRRSDVLATGSSGGVLRYRSRAGRGRFVYLEVTPARKTRAASYYTLSVSF